MKNEDDNQSKMYSTNMVLCTGSSGRVGRPQCWLSGNLNNMTVSFHILAVVLLSIFFSPLNATKADYEGEDSY